MFLQLLLMLSMCQVYKLKSVTLFVLMPINMQQRQVTLFKVTLISDLRCKNYGTIITVQLTGQLRSLHLNKV